MGGSILRRSLISAVLAFGIALAALGQTAEVMRSVNLRADPSASHASIRLLLPTEMLELLEPGEVNGYYHVRTDEREEGWVWSHNVRILEATPTPTTLPRVTATQTPVSETPTATQTPIPETRTATRTPAPRGPASALDEKWEKPEPVDITYTTVHGTCEPGGKPGSDIATNLRKNRVDTPSAYHEVAFDAIANLPYPRDAKSRASWTPVHLAQIARFEGVAVSVIGYLSRAVRVEGKESTNCDYDRPDPATEVDWNMYLTSRPAWPITEAVIVEATPRVRKDRKWNRATLLSWVDSLNPVRISGWLMLDPENANVVGRTRTTLWEIHPITKIEVWRGGAWIDLESLP